MSSAKGIPSVLGMPSLDTLSGLFTAPPLLELLPFRLLDRLKLRRILYCTVSTGIGLISNSHSSSLSESNAKSPRDVLRRML